MKTTPIILLIAAFATIVGVFYFYIFHGELSVNSQDWASFGGYMSGLLLPIFTAINIWVFVRLTQTIDKQNKKLSKEESEKQQTRHKNELEHQKRMVITQIRQEELNRFSEFMNNALIIKLADYKSNLILPLVNASVYLESFMNSKNQLFPILDNIQFAIKIKKLHNQITEFSAICNKFYGIGDQNETLQANLPDDFHAKSKIFLDTKNEVVSELENFILEKI